MMQMLSLKHKWLSQNYASIWICISDERQNRYAAISELAKNYLTILAT